MNWITALLDKWAALLNPRYLVSMQQAKVLEATANHYVAAVESVISRDHDRRQAECSVAPRL